MTMDVSTLAVKVTSDGIKQASDSLSGLGTSAKNAETKVVSLTASVEKLMTVQKTATGAAMAYAQALSGAQQHLGGNQASTLGLETATAMLARSMAALSASLAVVKEKTIQSTVATRTHTAAMQDAHAAARGLAGGLGALWLTYGNIVPMVAGVALARGFMEAAKSGAEFAYQLKFVQGLGEETAATMDKVSASILNMSKGSMFSPVEMAEGMRVLSQAGLDAANALKVLPQAMDLAVVGEMSLEKASITLVGVMNAFNLSVADIPHVGDVFAKAAAVSQTSVEQMTNSMKTASVVGSQYGVTMEDTATALTLLAKVNITGTAAGTSLKNMLKELYAPGVQSATLMKNLGLQTSDAAGELRPFADIIYDLQKKLKDFDKVSQTQILQRLFGERGAKEAIAMLSQTREEWDKLQSSITNSDGFMRKVSATLEDTVKGKWIQAVNTFKAQMIQAFEAMAPHLAKMADDLQAMFSDESFVTGLKKIVGGIASLTATLVSLAPIIINVAEAWLVYKSAMVGAAVWTAASTAVTGFSGAMLAMSGAMGPTITGMTGVRGVIAALPSLLMAIPTPMTVIAGLLAAGATAWFIWGDNASRAGDKAFDAANRAEAVLEKSRNRAKYGVGDLGEARKELDNAENLLGLRVQGRAAGTALSDARAAVDKWSEVVNTLEAEAQKASGASTTLNNALVGKPGGRTADEVMGGNDKAAIADRYAAALETIKGRMQEINDWSKASIAELSSLNKQGLVGDIELIEERKNVEQAAHAVEMGLIQEKIDAETPKNRTALQQKFRNEMASLRRQDVESENKAAQEIAEFFVKEEERKRQASIAGYKAEGQYVEAFLAEQGAMYSVHIAKLNRDIERETDPKRLKDLNDALKAVEDTLKKGTAAAQFKQADMAAQALIRTIEEGVTEIQAKATDGSFFGRLFAMEEMSSFYENNLPKLQAWLEAEKHVLVDGTDESIKQYRTREIAFNKMVKHQRDIYKDFIADVDRIGSEGFRALFDRTDGSWKSYVKKMKDSFKTYLIDEIYKMLARPFVMNILANIAGAAGATGLQGALTQAAGSGGVGGLLSTGNSAYNLATGGASSMYTSFATSSLGSSLGLSTPGLMGPTVTGEALSGLTTLGTALPYVGAALAAVSLISGLFGDSGPVDRNSKYQRAFGASDSSTGTLQAGGADPWRSNFRFSDNEMGASLSAFNENMIVSEKNAIKALGITAEQIAKINTEMEKSADQIYNFGIEHSDWLNSTADEQIAAARLLAISTALGKSVAEIVAAMDPMFSSLVEAGKNIGLTADDLLKVAGSSANMQALTGNINTYFNAFYSDAEKLGKAGEAWRAEFAKIDEAMPTTKDGFKGLVDALDLTKEADQKRFNALMAMSGGFSQYIDAVTQAGEATKNATDTISESAKVLASNKLDRLTNIIGIRSNLLTETFEKQLSGMSGTDQVAALKRREAGLWDALNAGDITAAETLKDTVLKRIGLETSASKTQLESATTLLGTMKEVQKFAVDMHNSVLSLQAGDLSPLAYVDQLAASATLWAETLAKAQSGDTTAMSALSGAGQSYLQEARSFYGANTDYANIFSSVAGGMGSFASTAPTDNAITTQESIVSQMTTTAENTEEQVEQLKLIDAALVKQQELASAQIVQSGAATQAMLDKLQELTDGINSLKSSLDRAAAQ